jgi:hypothetical protein
MPEIVSQGSGPISGGVSFSEAAGASSGGGEDAPTPFDDDSDSSSGVTSTGGADPLKGQQEASAGESDKPQSAAQKRESRYERTKRQRAAFNAERAAFAQERAEWQRQQQEAAEKAKGPKFDLGELKTFREQWKAEENWDLVEKADAKIKELEAEEGQKRSQATKVQTWHQAERELSASDPDFLKQGTRLDTRIREIMKTPDGDIYRGHERGIIAVYHRAKMELLQEDFTKLQAEHQALQQEHQRVTGLTSISGGTPGRMGNGSKEFSSLSTAEMRKRLASGANRMPWI